MSLPEDFLHGTADSDGTDDDNDNDNDADDGIIDAENFDEPSDPDVDQGA